MEQSHTLYGRRRDGRAVLLRVLRAVFLATSVYAFLFWTYIVLRIVVSKVGLSDLFIDGIPYFSFYVTGLWAFVIGFASLIIYLAIRDGSRPLIHYGLGEEASREWLRNQVNDYRRLEISDPDNKFKIEVSPDQIAALLKRSDMLENATGPGPDHEGSMVTAMEITDSQGRPVIVVVPKGGSGTRPAPHPEDYEVLIVEDLKDLNEEAERIRAGQNRHIDR